MCSLCVPFDKTPRHVPVSGPCAARGVAAGLAVAVSPASTSAATRTKRITGVSPIPRIVRIPRMGDRLRPLWDFDDLDASRERFLAQLAEETTDAGRAEVLTQLARVESLRDEFERCDELLDEAEALGGVTARLLLERGRRERSSGRDGAGLAEFRQAFELAQESGEDVLAADAAHMLALVDDAEGWTARGIDIEIGRASCRE